MLLLLSLAIKCFNVRGVSNPLGNKLDKNYKLNLYKVPVFQADDKALNRSYQHTLHYRMLFREIGSLGRLRG